MPPPSLWDRLRKARVVQVLLVYLGASWIVLQIIETLMGLLTLPSWVGPVALLLLLVGLFVVLATAWVQALPQTTAREEAGEIPTDWQVAPADVLASLKKGRLPHLTWGRAIVGGLVALSLLVGAAGGYVLLGGSGGLLGPSEAGAEDSASGIAVLPFHVAGPSLDLYREGMVDLMSSNLDGLSGYRAVDARTVLARWKRDVGEGNEAEMDEALRVAAGTGARYAVVGSGVELGARIRFTADLYDLATGEKVGSGQAEGDPDDVLSLVDGLTVEVMRSLLDATGQGSAGQDLRLASLLTRSVPALRDYLQGDALFRKGRFAEAREALERAVQEDSTFALAHWRLGEAIGWITGIGDREGQEHKRLAARYGDRLPPREATLLAVSSAISRGRAMEELETLETYLRRYPDDPDGWYNLGEMALHAQQATGIVDDRVEEALYKAVELDPTFSPYYLHALEWASAKGERERFDSLMAGWERAGEEEAGLTSFRIRGDLLFGDEEQRAAAAEELGSLDRQGVSRVSQLLLGAVDRDLERLAPVEDEMARREMPTAETRMARYREEGRFAEAEELARADESWDGRAALGEIVGQRWRQGGADTAEVRAALTTLSEGTPPPAFRLGVAFARVGLASALRDRTAFDQAAPVVQANLVSAMAPLAARYDTAEVRTVVEEMVRSLWLQSHGQAAEAFHLMDGTLARELAAGRLAELAVDAGQWSDVVTLGEGVSRGAQGRSTAKYDLGRAYEALGDQERALDAYRTFLSRYEKADPGLAWVEEAKAAVARLGG